MDRRLYDQMLSMRVNQMADAVSSPAFESLLMQPRIVRCRIKHPVPHPLSVAVRSTIPGATNETSFRSN